MPLNFPDFDIPHLEQVGICASILPADAPDLSASLTQRIRLKSKYDDTNGNRLFVFFLASIIEAEDGESRIHFHIDVAGESFFLDDLPNEDDFCDFSDLQNQANQFIGKPIEAIVDSRFSLPLDDLDRDSFIWPILDIKAQSDDGKHLEMTGGRCDLGPEPARRMTWFVRKREPILVVDIEAILETTVSDRYIEESIACILPSFETFVTERSSEESESE